MKIHYNNTFNCYESTEVDINKFGKRIELDGTELTPVIIGQWIDGDSICPCCGKDKYEDLDADIYADWQPRFCPNCCAKMKLSERQLLLNKKESEISE